MRIILYLLFLVGSFSYAQERLNILVESLNDRQPLPGAVIHFLGKHYTTDSQGFASIEIKKNGEFPIKISFLGYVDFISNVKIPQGNSPFVVKMQEEVNELSQVVVSSTKNQKISLNVVSQVIGKKKIDELSGESLAKMISQVQGVSLIQTGATIAKPVIHGLHSNRILILNNEVRQEGQQWSQDHAPEIDPLMASQIVVVKGADAVRYGSDALGGVIILSPDKLPYSDALHGSFSAGFSSNSLKTTSSIKVESSFENLPNFAWRVQASHKKAGDFKTAEYYLNNTGLEELNFSVSAGYEKKNWSVEAFFSQFNNESGVFFGSHIGSLEDLFRRFELGRPEQTMPFSYQIYAPRQEVVHHLFKIKSFVNINLGKISLQYAFQDDIRKEFSVRRLDRSKIPALNMGLKTHSLDLSWENSYKNWKTQIGINAISQSNINDPFTGVVPILPNFASFGYGVFGIQKYVEELWQIEAGLRYDYKILNSAGYDSFSNLYGGSKKFNNITYTLGGSYHLNENLDLTTNLGLAWRAPSPNELYSNGLHHGAGTYQVGDENLNSEKGLKWVSGVKFRKNKFSISAEGFLQHIKNYIYDSPTGKTKTLFSGVYPIFRFNQSDAFFRGADLSVNYQLTQWLNYEVKGSVIYANDLKTKSYFPLIPSERISSELMFNFEKWSVFSDFYLSLKHQFVAKQTRYKPEEELVPTTPDAYHLFGATMGMKLPIQKNQSISLHLSAENLLNELYKEYTNRFRYYAHDMGRNIQFKLIYHF